jgi:enamine deaminase RidA (YjgF/YER057c/UK114 family)
MPQPERLTSDRVPTPMAHYSQGVRVGDLIFLAGQIASDYRTGVPAELGRQPGYEYYGSDIKDQTRYVLQNIQASLEDGGSDLDHVVKTQVFLLDSEDFNEFDEVWREFFPSPPPRTTVETGPKGLLVPGTRVEIDVTAVRTDAAEQPERLTSDRVPKPLANYTQATRWGDFLFLAGQVPSHFGEGGIAPEARVDPAFPYYASPIERQTEYTLDNLAALLEDIGSDLEHVVKAQVFLTDLKDFWEFDSVWKEYFPTPPPRTTLQVGRLLLEQALVEIDLIAVRKDGSIKPEVINTDAAPHPKANYSQATVAGDLVFLAGQLASDFQTGVAPEARVDPAFRFYGSEIESQTDYVTKNIETVLKACGSSLDNVVKAQTFLTDLDDFHGYDKVWKRHFETPPPRTTIELAGDGLLVPGTLVEIDVIAARE